MVSQEINCLIQAVIIKKNERIIMLMLKNGGLLIRDECVSVRWLRDNISLNFIMLRNIGKSYLPQYSPQIGHISISRSPSSRSLQPESQHNQ